MCLFCCSQMKCPVCGLEVRSHRRHFRRHHTGLLSTVVAATPVPLMSIRLGQAPPPPVADQGVAVRATSPLVAPPEGALLVSSPAPLPMSRDDMVTPPAPPRSLTVALSLSQTLALPPTNDDAWMADEPMILLGESDGSDPYSAPLTPAPPPPSPPPASEAAQALPSDGPDPYSAPLTLTPLPSSPPPAPEAAQALPGNSPPRVGAVHVDPPAPQSLIPISLDGAPPAAQFLEGTDIAWASTLKAGDQRRLCDCVGCISHTKDTIRRRDDPRDHRPQVLGLRYVHPPGLGLRQANRSEIAELSTIISKHPERSLRACACQRCTLHRNFVKAWLAAVRFEDQAPRSGKLSRPRQNANDPPARRRL